MQYKIQLATITQEHSNDLFAIYSDQQVCKYFDIYPFITLNEAETQVKNWIEAKQLRKQIRYGIFIDKKLIETCGIYSIYWHQKRASLGYDLNSDYWNKGIISKALPMLFNILKTEYNLHRIQATLLPDNIASKNVLDKLNFTYEGLLKDYEIWKGEYVSLEMYSKIL